MEINKLIVLFESYKEKDKIINSVILPYKYFFEGYYATEIRVKNKLEGYSVIFLNENDQRILASTQIISKLSFNKYAVNEETLKYISEKIKSYISLSNKIILIEFGSIYLLEPDVGSSLINLFASDKKTIVFAKKSKEIESTMNKLYDAIVINLTKKESKSIKKVVDRFIGEAVLRMEING
ncbi:MAG: nucleoside-triphosphatase [Elusimicrobiales bacterium]